MSADEGICLDEVNAGERNSDTWTWVLIFALLLSWCFFAFVMWMFWRKFQQELGECDSRLWYVEDDIWYWRKKVARHEEYIATQGIRIDNLRSEVKTNHEQVLGFNENSAMDHDYIVGLHYAVVAAGGFVRFPLPVEDVLWMSDQEQGNLVSHGGKSGTNDPQTNPLQDLVEELKVEHRYALEDGQERDASRMQRMMVEMLQAVKGGGINQTMVDEFYNRTATMFQDLADKAKSENRTQSALYYGRRGSDYRGDA